MIYTLFQSSSGLLPVLLFLFGFGVSPLSVTLPFAEEVSYSSAFLPHSNSAVTQNKCLHLLAARIEFQPDQNPFTSGNGTFDTGSVPYLESPGTSVDALPHDQGYFEAHLEFAKNYFERNSGNGIEISYSVLPAVYRLQRKMEEYSPVGENPGLEPLADLMVDSWSMIAESGSLDLPATHCSNIAFILFHAGIGRDIELTGTSLDRTPQDIPSAYLSLNSLRDLLDDPSFSGISINNGSVLVSNTLIIPRTLSRAGTEVNGDRFVVPLSVNGLLTSRIGSHLGLPDLFNTTNGRSGIGRFGLMDGAGIFSYNGLFPPNLSAWERVYLGWAEPFGIQYDSEMHIALEATSETQPGEIGRVSISSDEYYLIENRHRDPHGTGVILTIRKPDGSFVQQTFSNEDDDFVNQSRGFDLLLEPGVVTDVSHFDFSLPGGLRNPGSGYSNGKALNGGILIWHIDESVIRRQINSTGINSNPDRRGVEVKEADGAQDIGRPIEGLFFQNEVNGSPFDFWWNGNDSAVITQSGDTLSLYQNRFGLDTFPNNYSHAGTPSFFELYDFSDNLPTASFRIRPVQPVDILYEPPQRLGLAPLRTTFQSEDPYLRHYPLSLRGFINSRQEPHLLISADNGFRILHLETMEWITPPVMIKRMQQPLILPGMNRIAAASRPDFSRSDGLKLDFYEIGENKTELVNSAEIPANNGYLSWSDPDYVDLEGTDLRFNIEEDLLVSLSGITRNSAVIQSLQASIIDNRLSIRSGTETLQLNSDIRESDHLSLGLLAQSDQSIDVWLNLGRKLQIYRGVNQYRDPLTIVENESLQRPAFGDLSGDGYPDIAWISEHGDRMTVRNLNGATLEGFPVKAPKSTKFFGAPLIADLNGNGNQELLIMGRDSYSLLIFGYSSSGSKLPGFPLLAGDAGQPDEQPVIMTVAGNYLAAVNSSNELILWKFPQISAVEWGSVLGDGVNNKGSYISSATSPNPAEPLQTLLDQDETYNWPNPARDHTHIRFHTRQPAEIRIRILTLSGRLIHDSETTSRGSFPEEIRIETSQWASGAYIALIEANDGKSRESLMFKIAVVR